MESTTALLGSAVLCCYRLLKSSPAHITSVGPLEKQFVPCCPPCSTGAAAIRIRLSLAEAMVSSAQVLGQGHGHQTEPSAHFWSGLHSDPAQIKCGQYLC